MAINVFDVFSVFEEEVFGEIGGCAKGSFASYRNGKQ